MVKTLAVVLAVASMARADVYSATQLHAEWSTGQVLSFDKFDPALGNLLNVRLTASALVGRVMDFTEVATPLGSYFEGIIQNNLALDTGMPGGTGFNPGADYGYWPFFFTFGDSPIAPPNPGTLNGSTTVRLANRWQTDLSRFIGDDSWAMTARGSTFAYACRVPTSTCAGPDALHDLSVSIDYDYTPVVVTPEPRWTAAILALLLLVVVRHCQIPEHLLIPRQLPDDVSGLSRNH